MLEGFREPAILLTQDYRILAANQVYRYHYRDIEHEPVGHYCYAVSHRYSQPCDQAGETCPLRESLSSGQPHRVLHLHHTPRGDEHVDVEMIPIRDARERIVFFLELLRHTRLASAHPGSAGLVGQAPAFNRMLGLVQRVSPTATTVLLLGESGTGKELVAQAIHQASGRHSGPFVPVDCSGLTETLFESELFGHEKGSFTGAYGRKQGLVEAAAGGTLFLDEIGDVPLNLQVKLLRLLETGTYRRVGGVDPLDADFRLLCATHKPLKKMVEEGAFRRDLYYRISAFPIPLPPLRERLEDLPLLCETLLRRLAPQRRLKLSRAALDYLRQYDFPGNIRELRNLLERASLLTDGEEIRPEHLPDDCHGQAARLPLAAPQTILPLAEVERRYLQWARNTHPGNRRDLARALGLSERSLYRKLEGLE
jgi:DNA-binding NtrC family response regulator